jgi:UDP-N-acetylmuramate dehydrogenase
MKEHTYFRIGGPASLIVDLKDQEELMDVIRILNEKNAMFFVMGNGSNLLVTDQGFPGVILKISQFFSGIEIKGHKVTSKAGVLLSTLSKKIAEASLEGFEFASGIPGTVGGGVTMNAGAYDGEMKDWVASVKILTQDLEILTLTNQAMNFGYRMSDVKRKDYIVLEATFEFKEGLKEAIFEKINDFTERRTSKQPLTLPSAGSMFKRPVGYYAGKLIDDSGLRGLRLGDAQISEKHCGFVVNRGHATCADVLALIRTVQKVVFDTYGVMLETEVKYLGV